MKLIAVLASAALAAAQTYNIATYAGGAPPPTPVPAAQSAIPPNMGFAADSGNVYFVGDNCVFKIDPSGMLTRVAGNSRWGSSGDNGPATSAEFSSAGSLAMDHLGNIYVDDGNAASDSIGNTVRKITPDGTITTVATGLNAAGALAVDKENNLYIIDGSLIRMLPVDGPLKTVAGNGKEHDYGDGGPAIEAGLGIPRSIAVDSLGNLYIAADVYDWSEDDYVSQPIRVVTPDGMIERFAGSNNYGYSGDGGPAIAAQLSRWISGVAVDAAGDVFIVDAGNHAIREVTPDGNISSLQTQDQSGCFLTGSGPYICARDIAIDPAGRIYIEGQYNPYIQLLGSDGSLKTISGLGPGYIGDGGPAVNATLANPIGIAVDAAQNVYIGDEQNNRIRRVAPDGTITTVAGNGQPRVSGAVTDGVPAISVPLACGPSASCKGIATDSAGNFYFADNDLVRKVSSSGIITTAASVVATGLSSDGKNIYIAAPLPDQILKLAPDGTVTVVAGNGTYGDAGDGGPATSAQLFVAADVAVDGAGNIYIAENYNGHVRKVTPDGIISTILGGENLSMNLGIAADSAGNVYVAEFDFDQVLKITPGGIMTTIAGGVCRLNPNNPCAGYIGDGGPATSAQLWGPARLAVDSNGNIYVADFENNAVRVLRPAQ